MKLCSTQNTLKRPPLVCNTATAQLGPRCVVTCHRQSSEVREKAELYVCLDLVQSRILRRFYQDRVRVVAFRETDQLLKHSLDLTSSLRLTEKFAQTKCIGVGRCIKRAGIPQQHITIGRLTSFYTVTSN